MKIFESAPNFKFASLKLLSNFENYSQSSLKILNPHCELLINILKSEEEDDSLKFLALDVLSKLTSSENLFNILETLKNILIKGYNNK